jgi:GntR family transcriptional regulator/MocR family aminotransferase
MAVEWTGLGPELLLHLDRHRAEPLGSQLQDQLRAAIRSGRLSTGERLPSTRELARELGVSRGLVVECFAQLEAEGYLRTRAGSATRVATAAQPAAAQLSVAQSPLAPAVTPPRPAIDFRPGVPDLASFPRRDWTWAMTEAIRRVPTADLDYGGQRGSAELRQVLAAYLRRVRGAVAQPGQIVVCTGFAQGLSLVLRAVAGWGVREVALEDPGYRDQAVEVGRAGVVAVPVPVDENGIDVAKLAATGARAVVLTPAHQSPTGVVLAPERRHALVAWARDRDAIIIEDDYDAEFRYDRQPVGVLQGLCPDRVAVLGTVSKSLAPALRLGWILCPAGLGTAVAGQKQLDDRGSPGLDQLALSVLMESGRYDRHLRRMRAVYAGRRDALVAALDRHAPEVRLHGLAAGFHAVASLPDGVEEEEVTAAALRRSVGLHGMSVFRSTGATRPAQLVLGFGNLSENSIQRGIAAISDLLAAPAAG